jgi:hypothetical protein
MRALPVDDSGDMKFIVDKHLIPLPHALSRTFRRQDNSASKSPGLFPRETGESKNESAARLTKHSCRTFQSKIN